MLKIVIPSLVVLLTASAPAFAQHENYQLATELGSVLASEEACGLEYDQAAIAAFIEDQVPSEDMGFADDLGVTTRLAESRISDLSKSQKTAHCAQIRRNAMHYGFISGGKDQ